MMSSHIRERFAVGNPFVFKHIASIRSSAEIDAQGPVVVMASPGMLQVMPRLSAHPHAMPCRAVPSSPHPIPSHLTPSPVQSGMSRELFESWCNDARNGIIVPGYCVEETLAKAIQNEPETITSSLGNVLPLRMSVLFISFSAHSDFLQVC
jgi:cleavage and polyadenylation specificity factor subunit 3